QPTRHYDSPQKLFAARAASGRIMATFAGACMRGMPRDAVVLSRPGVAPRVPRRQLVERIDEQQRGAFGRDQQAGMTRVESLRQVVGELDAERAQPLDAFTHVGR